MEPDHRRAINDNIDNLANFFIFSKIEPYVKRKKIFTSAMLEDISSFSADEDKKKKFFLEELQTRGPYAFEKFIEILDTVGCSDAVKLLKRDCNIPNEEKEATSTPDYLSNNYTTVIGNINECKVIHAKEPKSGPQIYNMTSVPRGYCLIINNVDFEVKMDQREGSDRDAMLLDKVFSEIGYKVFMRRNLNSKEMIKTFKSFSEDEFHKTVDSCVIIILTHGDRNVIYGVDEEPVYIDKMLEMFNNENCPLLKGKPKMFFIQACRGKNIDNSVPGVDQYDAVKYEEPLSDAKSYRLPLYTDMIICYATIDGFFAVRNSCIGSWYCQCLAKVLMEKAYDTDLDKMLMLVDSSIRNYISADGGKQATESVRKGWNRLLYFNPGR